MNIRKVVNYIRRDNHWLSLVLGLSAMACGLFLLGIIIYSSAGVGAYSLAVVMMVFAIFMMLPGFFVLGVFTKKWLVEKGYIKQKPVDPNKPKSAIMRKLDQLLNGTAQPKAKKVPAKAPVRAPIGKNPVIQRTPVVVQKGAATPQNPNPAPVIVTPKPMPSTAPAPVVLKEAALPAVAMPTPVAVPVPKPAVVTTFTDHVEPEPTELPMTRGMNAHDLALSILNGVARIEFKEKVKRRATAISELMNEIVDYRAEKKKGKNVEAKKNKIAKEGMQLLTQIRHDPIVRPTPVTAFS